MTHKTNVQNVLLNAVTGKALDSLVDTFIYRENERRRRIAQNAWMLNSISLHEYKR